MMDFGYVDYPSEGPDIDGEDNEVDYPGESTETDDEGDDLSEVE